MRPPHGRALHRPGSDRRVEHALNRWRSPPHWARRGEHTPWRARRPPEHQGAARVRTRHRPPLLRPSGPRRPTGPPRSRLPARRTPRRAPRITPGIAIGNTLRPARPGAAREGHRDRRHALGRLQLRPGPVGPPLVRRFARRRGRYGPWTRGPERGLRDPAAAVRAGVGTPGRRAPGHGAQARAPACPAAARTAWQDGPGEHGEPQGRGTRGRSRAGGRPMGRERHGSSPRRTSQCGNQAGRLTGLRVQLRFFSANFR